MIQEVLKMGDPRLLRLGEVRAERDHAGADLGHLARGRHVLDVACLQAN